MSSWAARREALGGPVDGIKIRLYAGDQPLSFSALLELFAASPEFADWYSELLGNSGFNAIFWEHPPLTRARLGNPVEFVVLDAPALADCRPDRISFAGHFAEATDDIAVFASLGGDARLVAPCPLNPESGYAHLTAFLRNAPAEQIRALWQQTGRAVSGLLGSEPIWLSTSGLGIGWLHIRLDSRPKYYQHRPYTII
ncbi:MAG: hypothetical protein P8Y61_07395 [Gammaproteobacteria bacterium]